ncbi:CDP-alcohol phosphatidyltransferase family protein [Chelatococcus reniformis]|uniref:CDP-diacylglycerol--glycerol-3-phosphate 3-phosphatidyltransferase n=1 Tax=Chelatococcus reniformis TaxID=1494448 RepID=A0A916UDQ8_9HYPH|nr:CDP-alcohol phosphatidyltransferase family protein [Chelatococcus reniformis]GGC69218.1 CDP-diacylglycerol--glycerol-3-phosphate 3-phosphatidyltransferase [Chelatococcus reniformis]
MTLPNLITIARLFMVPLVVAAIGAGRWQAAFVVFVLAGLSDAVDGFIARRWNMRSELGAYIDPFADKALLVSIYVALSVAGALPGWVAIVVVSRDVMIVSAIVMSWLLERPMAMRPLAVSKINTAAQIAFAAIVLAANAFDLPLGPGFDVGVLVIVVLTLLSAGAYLALWLRHMAV